MASFSVGFLGCKVSQTDAQALRERLLRDGHTETDGTGDVAVVNTCCVTNEGLAKSRQAASRAARSHGRVYVTGCGGAALGDGFRRAPRRTSSSSRARSRRRSRPSQATSARSAASRRTLGSTGSAPSSRSRTAAPSRAAFCVIPRVRGATRSRSAAAVLAEIRRRVAQGHREVVLTGVNLGCFRDRAAGYTLARLIREAGAVEGVERLRLSSIEINHVTTT